ncbi:MAG: class I SAM-dependent methyltransferase [Candidatus Tectimicrobiota bacterium]
MQERERIHHQAETFFEEMWQDGDPWGFESSTYEQDRYARLLACLNGRSYTRVLELGCGAGAFTRLLAPLAQEIIALDVSQAAITQARQRAIGPATVDFRQMNAMEYPLEDEGPWDLIILSDTVCYLGWLYSFFDVSWFAKRLFLATRPGGQCLLANAINESGDWLLRPWVIHTYRDLFQNVGYALTAEDTFRGMKNDVPFASLISLFTREVEHPTSSSAGMYHD